ncbi:MAG: PD-(D/E)XK nuclease family protein [Ruminococcus sp.]|nr:PD-(D/E)XK nuclease family protein [Ruminococcus sp.]
MKISASKVKCYKACKKKYYFSYVEELQAVKDAQTLVDGSNYHSKIESLYNTGDFEIDFENPKVSAMATAYKKYIYPQFEVRKAEECFEYQLSEDCTLVGRFDGIAKDDCVVEHKTTSSDVDEEYIYGLQWDEQILDYMLASGKNEMYYTVCKKPTIRLKQNETNEEFYQRCVEWYDTDTDKKIRVIKVTRNQKEIEQQKEYLKHIASRMEYDEEWYKATISACDGKDPAGWFYRNPSHCTCYGRRCEFASICLDYDPTMQYVEFQKKCYK